MATLRGTAKPYILREGIANFVERLGYGPRSSQYFAIQKWLKGQRETLPMYLREAVAGLVDFRGLLEDTQRDFRMRRRG